MTSRPSKKPTSAGSSVKILISASALAATLGGWATLAYQERANANTVVVVSSAEPTQVEVALVVDKPAYLKVEFPAMPTLVPVPTLPKPGPTAIPTKVKIIYVQPVVSAPAAPAADPLAGLRVVDVPPPPPPQQQPPQPQANNNNQNSGGGGGKPVTTTKSSKP